MSKRKIPHKTQRAKYKKPKRTKPYTLEEAPYHFIPESPLMYKKAVQYMPLVKAAADQAGVPINLVLQMIQRESKFNPTAVSPVGAEGIMQLMPKSFPDTTRAERMNPATAIPLGVNYLAKMYRDQGYKGIDQGPHGPWQVATGSYNAGPSGFAKRGGLSNNMSGQSSEARNYVNNMMTAEKGYKPPKPGFLAQLMGILGRKPFLAKTGAHTYGDARTTVY